MSQTDKEERLSGWKQIANFLQVEIRACQRWEKDNGLPVKRYTDTPKSRVWASKNELEDWLKSEKNNRKPEPSNSGTGTPGLIKKALVVIPAVMVLAGLMMLLPGKARQPADFRIQDSWLIITDQKGEELWRFDTGVEKLKSDGVYRKHFQYRRITPDRSRDCPFIIIKDINRDGLVEVLFSLQTQDERGGGKIFYFSHLGREIWQFRSGREITFGQIKYSNDFSVSGIDIHDLDNDGKNEIIVISYQVPHFPTQLVVLSLEKELLGEYWHCGRLSDYTFVDLDRDGKKEIVLSGMNNEYKKGCLLVLESGSIRGSSPQKQADYRSKQLTMGSEKYYILFPRTEVNRLLKPMGNASVIGQLDNGNIIVNIKYTKLGYEFDQSVRLQALHSSHSFEFLHRKFRSEGKIANELNKGYLKGLREKLLYFNGKDFTPRWSMSNPW